MDVALPIAAVFVSCSVNVVILEQQIKLDSGSTNLITFSQFVFNAAASFCTVMQFGRKKTIVPVRYWLFYTIVFFVQSVANNNALSYDIGVPLHMILKSSTPVVSMLLSAVSLQKKYSLTKWIAVMAITAGSWNVPRGSYIIRNSSLVAGIAVCTLASAESNTAKSLDKMENQDGDVSGKPRSAFATWLTGVGLVLFSVVVAAGMGIYQEVLFKRFGRQAIHEGIFYSHALPLPGFLFLWNDLVAHMKIYSSSDPVKINLELVDNSIPVMWLLLMANVVTMYGCTTSVFSLIVASSSLTVTLVVTLRKFVSLILSVFLFRNSFTSYHWLGTLLVFGGTLLYTDVRLLKVQVKEKQV